MMKIWLKFTLTFQSNTTFVDNNTKDGASYRLEITPQMKKDYLKKGAARFKTGGYIKERL